MQDALVKLKNSTSQLQDQLRSKTDSFQKFCESAKESKEQRSKELEDLKSLSIARRSEKTTREDDLKSQGDQRRKEHEEAHIQMKADLQKQIDALQKQIDTKSEANRSEEQKLTSAFESADKMYAEALDSYDTEMQNHHNELAD